MTEGLFILTTIFVAYVVYQVVNDQKKTAKPGRNEPAKKVEKPEPPKPQAAAKKEEPAPSVSRPAEKKEEPAAVKPAAGSAPAATVSTQGKAGLRDPKTGEVSTAYANYRFTKRWIKEALVAEGLLTKIYKNNELDAETETKIKAAMTRLEAMDKYRA
ncbi:MAG: hypothetical protein ACU841_00495 [Gammaproteobacteria bacterium]